jgi:hypothetical protein
MARFFIVIFYINKVIFINCMVRKTRNIQVEENELYILPSINDEMRAFVNKFKIDMMEHVVSSIKFAVEHKRSIIEVFQFKNSPYVVTIAEHEFDANLEYIYKFYKDKEFYELCPRIEQLQKLLKKKNDKKENPEADDDGDDINSNN